ncbi:MAG: hypothetical protein CL844_09290 [Crocinitomicaceae bacterium]|nr:hypothetical protein [Crocinitomicaceae bacterium]|tara:strand:- start:2085 stop:3047 length:963 start_codon:yes stop_codon:yes gene_type:complete
MKTLVLLVLYVGIITSCVPAKRYNELLEKELSCKEELNKFKKSALDFEADAVDLLARFGVLSKEVNKLKQDTTEIGQKYRSIIAKYNKLEDINKTLESNYEKIRLSSNFERENLQNNLQEKQIELQNKEDELLAIEQELIKKEELLFEREEYVKELEKIISDKDNAVKELKSKVKNALQGFENKGLSIIEKNGKIYVSLEASLLFSSGSTMVEKEGEKALIDLAKVLEAEKELEIIVEGHTDVDKLISKKHPKNNWELSVLRSTSVINIMLKNSNINPSKLMAAGRSEFIPIDIEDKSKNRRIEIIISPNLNELFKLISK